MKKIKFFIMGLFLLGSVTVYSQIGVSTYSIYSLGVNTSKEKKISGELKSFFNRGSYENIRFELSGMYNFKARDYYQFSAGLGVNVAPFYGYDQLQCFTLPVQLEVFPLQNFRQLSLVIEVAPEWYLESDLDIRHMWGIRYTFAKK